MKPSILLRAILFNMLWMIPYFGFSQVDLKSEILSFPDTKVQIIAKSRAMILDRMQKNDTGKVIEIKTYLRKEVTDKETVPLYPNEKWLIDFRIGDYPEILREVVTYYDDIVELKKATVFPPRDGLFNQLVKLMETKRDSVFQQINESRILSFEEKQFLRLQFNHLILRDESKLINQDTLNHESDRFIVSYPHSKFEGYIRYYIRYVIAPSNWGLDFEFFSGYATMNKDLGRNFKSLIPFGVAFQIYYKKHVFFLRDYIGIGSTANDITYQSVVWKKNSQSNFFIPEAAYGYIFLDNKICRFIPSCGIAATMIGAPTGDINKHPEYEKMDFNSLTWTLGCTLDIKFGNRKGNALYNQNNFGFVRIRYTYNMPQFDNKYSGFSGTIHSITIGAGGFSRPIRRSM
jgi:hypothetical protein